MKRKKILKNLERRQETKKDFFYQELMAELEKERRKRIFFCQELMAELKRKVELEGSTRKTEKKSREISGSQKEEK